MNNFKKRSERGNTIRDKNRRLLIENEYKVKRWKEYLEDLYKGRNFNAKIVEDESDVENEYMGRLGFDAAIRDLK